MNCYGCYDHSEEWYLIEMALDAAPSQIEWSKFVVPEKELPSDSWQCPYLEQYLNHDGTERICELYDLPKEDSKPCRVAFFIFKTDADALRTPYGDFLLTKAEEVPMRLRTVVKFEEID